MNSEQTKALTAAAIQQAALVLDIDPALILSPSRKRETTLARHIVCWWLSENTPMHLQQIADAVNRESHATVLNSINTVYGFVEMSDDNAGYIAQFCERMQTQHPDVTKVNIHALKIQAGKYLKEIEITAEGVKAVYKSNTLYVYDPVTRTIPCSGLPMRELVRIMREIHLNK